MQLKAMPAVVVANIVELNDGIFDSDLWLVNGCECNALQTGPLVGRLADVWLPYASSSRCPLYWQPSPLLLFWR
jgi:hypothetical protein